MSFKIKPQINEEFPILDIFTDHAFFHKFKPVIIKLKKPITLQNNNKDDEFLFSEFVTKEISSDFLNETFFYIENYADSYSDISIELTELDIEIEKNPDFNKVLSILKNTKTKKGHQITPLFFVSGESADIFSGSKAHKRNLINGATSCLISDTYDKNGNLIQMDIAKFIQYIPASEINHISMANMMLDTNKSQQISDKLSIHYNDYFKEGILGHGRFFFKEINNGYIRFSKEWLEEINTSTKTTVFTLIDKLTFSSDEDKLNFEIKALQGILLKTEIINNIIVSRYKDFPEDKLNLVISGLNNIDITNKSLRNRQIFQYGMGNVLKDIIDTINKDINIQDLMHSNELDNLISFEIPWQKTLFEISELAINLSKMHEVYNTPEDKDKKYSKDTISYISRNFHEDAVIVNLLLGLGESYKTFNQIHPWEIGTNDADDNIYAQNGKLFIDLLFPKESTNEDRIDILQQLVKNINLETLKKPTSQERILSSIIKMKMHMANPNLITMKDDNTEEHTHGFKI